MMLLMQIWTQQADTINRMWAGKPQESAEDAAALSEAILPIADRNTHIAPIKNRQSIFMSQAGTTSLKVEIEAALISEGLVAKEVEDKDEVLLKIECAFVKDRPRTWWSSLAEKPKIYTFNDNSAYLHINEIAPPTTDDVWFIADDDNEEKLVFSIPLSKIQCVIEECRYFEYYIVNKKLEWLLAENDHGDLIFFKKS